MNRSRDPASLLASCSVCPGSVNRGAVRLWHAPAVASEAVLAATTLVWGALVLAYGAHALRDPARLADESAPPVGSATHSWCACGVGAASGTHACARIADVRRRESFHRLLVRVLARVPCVRAHDSFNVRTP
ncbi:hypothetical protein [Caballeronia sp. INDeC2]|uniref:hypothetical protein n=1 Tax=Caballeronia sp. INDeC2 TaxID=2921747 RepID=UPI0020296367|nr:hypothetical protein [Caballeronia sp. INDeC2]